MSERIKQLLCKKCGKCGEWKPLQYYSRDCTQRDGYDSWCKECMAKQYKIRKEQS